MGRIEVICSYLEECNSFADIGCDHGYCTRYMLKNDLCKEAIITDISAKSLNKAEVLLDKYINNGRCKSVCCDGLKGVDSDVDLVLIAGMGGEEIIKILKEAFIPKNFVFQPMKNAPMLRKFLLDNGCKITRDDIFQDGKYYFIIKGSRQKETQNCQNNDKPYTQEELEFGRDSLKNEVLLGFLNEEIQKNSNYLLNEMSDDNRKIIENRIKFLQGAYSSEIK
jgi:tRNA (adenine22-N1)-methyltransferase